MNAFQWKTVGVLVLGIVVFLPHLSHAQSQPPATRSGQSDRVFVAYVPPDNSSFQDVYDLLRQHNALEKIKEILSPFQFPHQLTIETSEFHAVNSYYQRKNFKPTVTICYEFLKRILELLPNATTPAGLTPTDAAVAQFFSVTFHDVGHAAFDMFNVPLFEHEEDAADNFATSLCCNSAKAKRGV